MEKKTIGRFIATLRKANGMTQKELGEKLFVSDKTVSRWECDECTPELSLIPSIAEIFNITTDELLRGERNNPERDAYLQDDVLLKQKPKSDKQFKLMLNNRKKKFTNLSIVSIGLVIIGLIVAVICDLVFLKGLLGFCLASIVFVAAAVCQICFTVSFRLPVDEDENDYYDIIRNTNTKMVLLSVKILFVILLSIAFCLPLAIFTLNGNFGITINSWIIYGALFCGLSFFALMCIYKIFVLRSLVSRSIVYLSESDKRSMNTESRFLTIMGVLFVFVISVIVIVNSIINEATFVKNEKFTNINGFINYVQNAYDDWYEEGYGDIPEDKRPAPEAYKTWGKIKGKNYDYYYYYYAPLYESIDILQYENGEWDIIVLTKEAIQKGKQFYELINVGLVSLVIINFLVCVIWYVLRKRKYK